MKFAHTFGGRGVFLTIIAEVDTLCKLLVPLGEHFKILVAVGFRVAVVTKVVNEICPEESYAIQICFIIITTKLRPI